MRIITLLFLLLLPFILHAQSPVSSRASAVGEAAVAFQDMNSLFFNQAGLANLDELGGIISSERRFLSDALNTFSGGFLIPTDAGNFGLSINYFGFSAFNQQKIGLVYARRLFEKATIGAELNVQNYRIPEYGNFAVFSMELGLQYELNDALIIGAHISNPIQQELVEDENLSTRLNLGLAYLVSDKLSLFAETEKDIDTPFRLKAGLEYQPISILYLRFGIGTAPTLTNFGIGLKISEQLKIDLSSSYHQQLGFSPGISIIYN